MTFKRILNSLYRTYNLDFCKLADSLEIQDETVLKWEKGEEKPTIEQLKKISACYAIPLAILEKSLKE